MQSFPKPGHKVRVSKDGGGRPFWTRDGREIIYSRRGVMMATPLKVGDELRLGEARPIFTLPPGVTGGDISGDGERCLVSVADERPDRDIRLLLDWTAALTRRR